MNNNEAILETELMKYNYEQRELVFEFSGAI